MKINPINNLSLKGVPIADIKVKGIDASYRLYSINHKDEDFLKRMYESADLKKLMPNLTDYDYIVWNEVFENAIKLSKIDTNRSILETYNNKPCGIMTYAEKVNNYHLKYVTTIPAATKKRVPAAGQILFNELFQRFVNSDKKNIELSAIRYAPFSPISTYLKLGFGMNGGGDFCEDMKINKDRALKTLVKQNNFITYTKNKEGKNIDLNKELSLDFII